ncbi:GrpE protein 1, mitochondrial [Quaeritorhiza haematococci]|nr:GrpE protein 1, mitochondrial [Quaeritorhiza haematococci]
MSQRIASRLVRAAAAVTPARSLFPATSIPQTFACPLLATSSTRPATAFSLTFTRQQSTEASSSKSEQEPKKTENGNGNGEKQNGELEKVKASLEEKTKQVAELQDLYRRALADMENTRQRTRKEVEQTSVYAIQKFAKDLLDTADVLQMALNAVPEAERSESSTNKALKDLYTGVSMTRAELLKAFKRHGVVPYDPTGEKFDPNLHQAMFQAPVPGKEAGTVFQTTKIGYKLNERVLRPAQVGVVTDTSS